VAGGSLDVVVRFLADASAVNREVDKLASSTGSKIKSFAKGAAVALGGAFAVREIGGFLDKAQESEKVTGALSKAMENAGDASGAWAKHANDLADSMQRKIGVDDETIKSAQTILTTFHGITGTLKDQPDLFDRTTKAAADLSAAGFGDMSSTAKALGKALEDPQKGLTALQRMGVKFTDGEKAQIKSMIEAGDKAGAYNIILGKVEGKVGGVAEKSVTAGDKMSVAWDEAQESIGRAFMPALEAVAPVLQKVTGFIEKNAGVLVPLAGIVAGVTAAVWLFNAALAANPIVLITIAIAGLVAGLIIAYQNVEGFRNICDTSFAAIKEFVAGVVEGFQILWDKVIAIFGWFRDVFSTVGMYVAGPFGAAWAFIEPIFGFIKGAAQGLVDWFATGPLSPITDWVIKPFQQAYDIIAGIWEDIKRVFGMAEDKKNQLASQGYGGYGPQLLPGQGYKGYGPRLLPGQGYKGYGPHLAAGGLVTSPTWAMIGEAGPEVVIPLNRARGMGVTVVNINVATTGLGASSPQIQSAVATALRNYTARNGPI
jgi:hypothetical protein